MCADLGWDYSGHEPMAVDPSETLIEGKRKPKHPIVCAV